MPSRSTTTSHSNLELRSGSKHDASNEKQSKGLAKQDATDCTQHWEDEEHLKQNQEEYKKFQAENRRTAAAGEEEKDGKGKGNEDDKENDDHDTGTTTAPKRGYGANSKTSPSKKQKTNGDHNGKGTELRGKAGDKTRVPKQGEKVQWEAESQEGSYVEGEVVEVAYEEKEVEGKKVEASKEDPRVVLKREGKGKEEICVLEPEKVYF